MKTKIIYISGNEVFEMTQIRAAFEEVRNALGLDNDTILFGVPVDADNALANTDIEKTDLATRVTTVETTKTIESDIDIVAVDDAEPEQAPEAEPITEIIPEISAATESEPEIEDTDSEPEKIIPILSILSSNEAEDAPEIETSDFVPETVTDNKPITESEAIDTLSVSIDEVVADDAPVVEHKKTLEDLLESMEPLGEDEITMTDSDAESEPAEVVTAEDTDFSISMTDDVADTDATLAQLANEFAQTQDKIQTPQKTSGNGKIGKLKNILPFKKAKRDDNGIMGDLFGWAGIAANDEDFSIPGFFTSAGGQK